MKDKNGFTKKSVLTKTGFSYDWQQPIGAVFSLFLCLVGGLGICFPTSAETLGMISCKDAKQLVRWFHEKSFQNDIKPFLQNHAYTVLKGTNDRHLVIFSSYANKNQTGRCLENRFFMKEGNTFYQLSQEYASYIEDVRFLPDSSDKNRKEVTESRLEGIRGRTALFWHSLEPGKEQLETRCCLRNKTGPDLCQNTGTLFYALPLLEQEKLLRQNTISPLPPIPKPIGLFSFYQDSQETYVYLDVFDPDPRLTIPHNLRLFMGKPGRMKQQTHVQMHIDEQENLLLKTHSLGLLTLPEEFRYPLEFSAAHRRGTPTWKQGQQTFLLKEIKIDANISQKLGFLKDDQNIAPIPLELGCASTP